MTTQEGSGPVVRFHVRREFADLAPPQYASKHSSGADLRAAVDADVTLPPLARLAVPTGLTLEIPEGYEGQVRARSGLALHKGLALANGVGTIDADYRGEVAAVVVNLGQEPVTIRRGDRIAQLVIARVSRAKFEPAPFEGALAATARDRGGFGSTGVS